MELIRIVPVDVLFPAVLKFLVWGDDDDDCDENEQVCADEGAEGTKRGSSGPSLLPPPLKDNDGEDAGINSSSPSPPPGFEALRAANEPLLITVVAAYPGFRVALLCHLVDRIIGLDEERWGLVEDAKMEDDPEEVNYRQRRCRIQSIERNLLHLSSWVRYVLAREFHMHFDRAAAVMDQPAVGKAKKTGDGGAGGEGTVVTAVDLKKKGRKKWTPEESEYARGPAPPEMLRRTNAPLNSLCDRLVAHLRNNVEDDGDEEEQPQPDDAVTDLLAFLESTLGGDRIEFRGIGGGCSDGAAVGAVVGDGAVASSSTPGLEKEGNEMTPSSVGPMSLEDIESMLGGGSDTKVRKPTGVDSATEKVEPAAVVQPWTLCTSWDACAIGTLPGYPS